MSIWKKRIGEATYYLEEGQSACFVLCLPVTESVVSPRSAEQLTSAEQLILDSEMDGSAIGEAKTEEKRRKDEEWAIFTDNNPKGAGNTMNRG
jgi:hypothetical protein